MRVRLRRVLWVFAVLLLVTSVVGSASGCRRRNLTGEQGNTNQGAQSYTRGTMQFDGRERSYLVHLPSGYQAGKQVPLLIVLHGGTGNAEQTVQMTGLNSTADKNAFIAVYPNGTGRHADKLFTWNVLFGFGYALRNNVDDVGFIRALVGALEGKYSIDPSRVYATGISNGAMLTYLLGSQASDVFAAIAPVSGAVGASPAGGGPQVIFPAPANPVSVIAFHGRMDRLVPYDGGKGIGPSDATYVPVSQSIGDWVTWDGCQTTPQQVKSTDGNVVIDRYPGGRNGTEVELVTVEDGGHNWPKGNDYPGAGGSESANDLMWEFLAAHPKM
jgi:polyhydroxybutyrate depolymerase